MSVHTTEQTAVILQQHLTAIAQGDLDAIMRDYTAESVLILPDNTLHGLASVRGSSPISSPLCQPTGWRILP